MPKKWIDVTGQKFGKLSVIHCNFPPKKRALVRCDCGFEFPIGIGSLLSGASLSCGATSCSTRAKNLTGQKFGFLTVTRYIEKKNNRGELLWECVCDCGAQHITSTGSLRGGGVKSCGCKQAFLRSQKLTSPIQEMFVNCTFYAYQASAEKRNLAFSLTHDDFHNLLFQRCFYCNVEPLACFSRKTLSSEEQVLKWNGIDRVNSALGYELENCVTCCKVCNAAKTDMNVDEFIAWGKRLGENLSKIFKE